LRCWLQRRLQVSSLGAFVKLRVEDLAVLPGNPRGAVEVDVRRRPLQQPLVFEPFDVGQIAQGGEPENLEESPCRDIGERRAGLGRAKGAVNKPTALERADDVAADRLAGEPRDFRAGGGLQIGMAVTARSSVGVSSGRPASRRVPAFAARIASANRGLVRN
jgi:hypothetical protein